MKTALRFVLLVGLLGLLAVQAGCNKKPAPGDAGTATGNTAGTATNAAWGSAPDFKFTTFGGEEKRLSDYAGRPIVLNFWAAW